MKSSLYRPVAWRIAAASLLLACAISASAQNKNASEAGALPSQPSIQRQPESLNTGNKNTAPTKPAGDTGKGQSDQPAKGGDPNKKEEQEQKASPVMIKSASNAAKPAPKADQNPPAPIDQVALGDRLRVVVSDRKALVGEPPD